MNGNINNLICWMEDDIQKWAMIKNKDFQEFGMELLTNKKIDPHTIFIIPEHSILSGLWLSLDTHKNKRVDFFHFYEDFGKPYEKPKVSKENEEFVRKKRSKSDTKYGFISPDGRYFHCEYQGHSSLADKICYGLVETNNPERYLEEQGWCKIFKPLFDNKYSIYIGGKHTITDAQMKTLIKMKLDTANGISEMLYKDKNDFSDLYDYE